MALMAVDQSVLVAAGGWWMFGLESSTSRVWGARSVLEDEHANFIQILSKTIQH